MACAPGLGRRVRTVPSPAKAERRYISGAGTGSRRTASPKAVMNRRSAMNTSDARSRRKAPLDTPTDLGSNATKNLSGALNILLADMFALYMKTKNFHWHVSGAHFRDYHLLLDEQADQIFATTDAIAERARKIGGTTLRSIGHIVRLQRVLDNDAEFVT